MKEKQHKLIPLAKPTQPPLLDRNKLGYVFAGLLALSVIGFSETRNPAFAIIGFVFLLALFVHDILPSKWSKQEILATGKELLYAVLLAVGAWLALQFILGTQAPLDVVTSCSMLPNLQRGDMILLQGKRPDVMTLEINGSFENLQKKLGVGRTDCTLLVGGTPVQAICTRSILYDGTAFPQKRDSDVIVFDASPRFYGLVVHRAFARLTNGTQEFYLTKGDNNLGIDQEAGFALVSPSDIKGVVIARIPLVGFLKLFLFMQFEEPQGCKQLIQGGE